MSKSISFTLLAACLVFGAIYAYYTGMFEPKRSGKLVMPPITFSSASSIGKPEWVPLSERSQRYVNERFKYSVLYPKYVRSVANCDYDPYPTGGYPVTVLENGDASVITAKMYAHDVVEPASQQHTCKEVEVTLDTIKADMPDKLWYYYGWNMVGQHNIGSDSQLLAFIRTWYGSSCGIKEKTPTEQPGTWDVVIEGDTGDDTAETSRCPLNFVYALKYSPEKKIAVTWKVGQDGRFDDLDNEMIKSFRFENE